MDGKGAVIAAAEEWDVPSENHAAKGPCSSGRQLFICVWPQEQERPWTFEFHLPIRSSVSLHFEVLCVGFGWSEVGL